MNKNKIILTFAFICFTLSSFTCKERQNIAKITFHYVGFEIETPFQISCNDFENLFSGTYKTTEISNKNQLKEFEKYLSYCDALDTAKKIDVRVKVIITYANKKISILCMDKFNNLVLDNKSISPNKDIIAFIRRQLNN
jgi:hypothetical protein